MSRQQTRYVVHVDVVLGETFDASAQLADSAIRQLSSGRREAMAEALEELVARLRDYRDD